MLHILGDPPFDAICVSLKYSFHSVFFANPALALLKSPASDLRRGKLVKFEKLILILLLEMLLLEILEIFFPEAGNGFYSHQCVPQQLFLAEKLVSWDFT